MKKIKYTLLVLLFALAIPFTCLAQWPSDFGNANEGTPVQGSNIGTKGTVITETDANPTDNPVPIDSNLWVLLLAGCTYMFFKYQKIQKKKKEDTVL